jgi:hypothetical protein
MSDLVTRVESTEVTVTLDNDGRDVAFSGPNYLEVNVLQGRDEADDDILYIQIGCEGQVKSIGHVKKTGIFAEFIPAKKKSEEEKQRCETCKWWKSTNTSKFIYNRECSNLSNTRKLLIPLSEIITYFKSWCEHWEEKNG